MFLKDSKVQGKSHKKDKKNIVKNIIKMFLSWLQSKKNEKDLSQYDFAASELREMMAAENYNNRLIKNISNNDKTCKSFVQFLTENAVEEIKYSRIKDKESHFQAVQLYLNLIIGKEAESK